MIGGHKIVGFALVCVAVSTAFIIYMQIRLTDILAAPDWCARAINAEKLVAGRSASAFETCKELLVKQVGSLAINSHIFAGSIALCLLVLIVIVVADARFKGKFTREGAEIDLSRGDIRDKAEAIQETAEEIKEASK